VTITYSAAPKPKAVTHRATGVKSTSATIHGSVNGEGLKTTYYFQYGTTKKYGQKTGKHSLEASGKFSSVKALLRGLKPSTTYHFRVVAKTATGTADGRDMTFTTPSVAPAFTG
jgi:phosphodiesterase/alkaline phosphatase D-like protein